MPTIQAFDDSRCDHGSVNMPHMRASAVRVFVVTSVVWLAFSASAMAAPPPGIAADPYTNYLLVRVLPNGTEKDLAAFEVTSWDSQEQLVRSVAFEAAKQQRTNNPSWRLILYGPIDPPLTYWTDDDRIWDSAVNL